MSFEAVSIILIGVMTIAAIGIAGADSEVAGSAGGPRVPIGTVSPPSIGFNSSHF
jgi:hypothetical protein